MAIKKILIEPNKILRQVSQPVIEVNKEIQSILDDMLETMYSANGIGLAAIQIGIPKRIIVMDISRNDEKKNPMYFVNPIIKNKNSDLSRYEEGCLSVPDQFAEVDRPSSCEVEYLDYNGNKKILEIVVIGSGDLLCSPCGGCRQRIREFASLDTKIHMCNENGHMKTSTLEELLPDSFGPENL